MSRTSQPVDNELVKFFDLSSDLFCIAGHDGFMRRVNRTFTRTLGYPEEELLSRSLLDIVHPHDLRSARDVLTALADGTTTAVAFESRVVCADRSVRRLEWKLCAGPDEGFVYGVARDVTERRMVHTELNALRRVATLVAKEARTENLFPFVAEEVARVVDAPRVSLARYEADGTATECATFTTEEPMAPASTEEAMAPAGGGWSAEAADVLRRVGASSAAARVDGRPRRDDGVAGAVRGARPTVGVPIAVAGRLWGAVVVSGAEQRPLPAGIETRLAGFTDLVATAIANAESRAVLGRLADEQAALRRVATLVAQGVRPAEIFSAVSEELDRLFGLDEATVGRFDPDGPAFVVVGVAKSVEGISLGSRWELNDLYVSSKVFRTGRSARVDAGDLASVGGPTAANLRRLGFISQVASPIVVEGRLWGALTAVTKADTLPPDTEERLEKFTALVGTAIANADSRAELAASRRRIVAASDEARRQIERDLHDGTQQRLASLALDVRTAEAHATSDGRELGTELSRIAAGLADALQDLQEMSRGIHPAILSHSGLGPALRTLARRSTIPVELDVTTGTRFPEPIEVAAYFVASEALANATKHARASGIEVSLATRDGVLLLSVRDDGVGGADPTRGSGLVGLADRVEALGGSIRISSHAGGGTEITAELPVEPGPAADAD